MTPISLRLTLTYLKYFGTIYRWYNENRLEAFGVEQQEVLRAYFLATSCIFEPHRAVERLAWARTSLLANTISTHLHRILPDKKRLECFMHCIYKQSDLPW